MLIKYIRDVAFPAHIAGKKDQTKELPNGDAQDLIDGGYVVAASVALRPEHDESTAG